MRRASYLAILVSTPVAATQTYSIPDEVDYRIEATCGGEKVSVFLRPTGPKAGLKDLLIAGKSVPREEMAKVPALIRQQRIASIQILGCRRTEAGDVIHWLQVDPALTEENMSDPLRGKWFYVRHGKVETHERQPVD